MRDEPTYAFTRGSGTTNKITVMLMHVRCVLYVFIHNTIRQYAMQIIECLRRVKEKKSNDNKR